MQMWRTHICGLCAWPRPESSQAPHLEKYDFCSGIASVYILNGRNTWPRATECWDICDDNVFEKMVNTMLLVWKHLKLLWHTLHFHLEHSLPTYTIFIRHKPHNGGLSWSSIMPHVFQWFNGRNSLRNASVSSDGIEKRALVLPSHAHNFTLSMFWCHMTNICISL